MAPPAGASAVPLRANTFDTFYRGAARIAGFRRDPSVPHEHPEDWVGSTTTRFGADATGLSPLPDGRLLLDAVAEDPAYWTGSTEDDRVEAGRAVLVKLLDAGIRLPLHVHPTRDFAREHLGSRYGKAEAWLVLHADEGAAAHLGFRRDVEEAELDDWVSRQDVETLLDTCHRVPLRTGDVVFCPAGVPHAIGAGVLVLEVQEPTDFSIMLEWAGFPIDPAGAFLGLEQQVALGAVARQGLDAGALERLRGGTIRPLAADPSGVTSLLPAEAGGLFRADQVAPGGGTTDLEEGFAVLVVNEGSGTLAAENAEPISVAAGETYVLPAALRRPALHGEVSAVRCAAG